ncbi:Aldo/keto reductase [Methylocella tundrae]|nr:Aldo/keto reductase [Methylocella tundrae]
MAQSSPAVTRFHRLGGSGLTVSALGLGCMSFSGVYGACEDADGAAVIKAALDAGINFLDTADIYGWGHNETLVGAAIAGRRDEVVLATKFGHVRGPGGEIRVNGRPDYVFKACDASLTRLKADHIDLYYQHRVDPQVPIDETVDAMAELIAKGKVRAIGLSEAKPETIRRAHRIHPLAAVQMEYSLLYRAEAEEVLATTRELGVAFVAYSPLGRGFLTGQIKSVDDLVSDDYRRNSPRFQGENFAKNLDLVHEIEAIAREKGCSPAQLSLAWVLAQGDDIVPIPGTKRCKYLEENVGALEVSLSAGELERISRIAPPDKAAGTRYAAPQMSALNR